MLRHPIYTIGHSDLPIKGFMALLRAANVTAIADVRSYPNSRRAPWFGRDDLEEELFNAGIEYRFLGEELGGRPSAPELFREGVANYTAMSRTVGFEMGLRRLLSGSKEHSIAVLCSEKDPLHCHRCLLVSRALDHHDIQISHLHHNGTNETQQQVEERLLREEGMEDAEMPFQYRLDRAYEARNRRVAYSIKRTLPVQIGFLE